MVDVAGRAGSIIVTDNFATGNAAASQYALHVQMTPTMDPVIHSLESIGYLSFRRNVWIMQDGRTTPAIGIGSLRPADVVDINDNDLTPARTGEMITHDGTGTIRHDSPSSNRAMPSGLFDRDYNPPRSFPFLLQIKATPKLSTADPNAVMPFLDKAVIKASSWLYKRSPRRRNRH